MWTNENRARYDRHAPRPCGQNMDGTGSGLPTPARHGQNERAITITRKNALFAGSDGGGRTWATIATLLQTAKMNDVDPLSWLAQTLQRIANGWPISQIEKLMPWNYTA